MNRRRAIWPEITPGTKFAPALGVPWIEPPAAEFGYIEDLLAPSSKRVQFIYRQIYALLRHDADLIAERPVRAD